MPRPRRIRRRRPRPPRGGTCRAREAARWSGRREGRDRRRGRHDRAPRPPGACAALPFTRSPAAASSSATHGIVTTSGRPSASVWPRRSSNTCTPPAPMAESVWPSRHARPRVSEMMTPTSTPRRVRSPDASARAEASGSTGSSSTVPSGVFDASTPAAAETMPSRFCTMRVVPPFGIGRVATTRTVSAVIASSRSSAAIMRPSAFETIFDVTTRMSPSARTPPAASAISDTRSAPAVISGMPVRAQAWSTSGRVSGRTAPR